MSLLCWDRTVRRENGSANEVGILFQEKITVCARGDGGV